jgi:hypothetical protein
MKQISDTIRKKIQTNVTHSGEEYKVFALLKFGQEQHLRDLLNKGILYFSSKQDIRGNINENRDDHRYDSLEGATMFESHGNDSQIFITSNMGVKMNIPALKVQFDAKPQNLYGNIASFYAITDSSFINGDLIPIDLRMKSFGDHFILITDFTHLIKRLTGVLDKIELNHSLGKIEYFDENNHKGDLHYYHKRSSLSYQNEFRIHLDRQSSTPFKLRLGNLSEFAVICHCDTLEHLNIKLDIEGNACNIQYLKLTY